MIIYHEPTSVQIDTFKKLSEYQNQIIDAKNYEEIETIVHSAFEMIKIVPTATYSFHDGTIRDFGYREIFEVLITDLDSYEDLKKLKGSLILTLDIIMSMFIVSREHQMKILN